MRPALPEQLLLLAHNSFVSENRTLYHKTNCGEKLDACPYAAGYVRSASNFVKFQSISTYHLILGTISVLITLYVVQRIGQNEVQLPTQLSFAAKRVLSCQIPEADIVNEAHGSQLFHYFNSFCAPFLARNRSDDGVNLILDTCFVLVVGTLHGLLYPVRIPPCSSLYSHLRINRVHFLSPRRYHSHFGFAPI